MTSHKDQKMKKFIISTRKKITTGLTNAPVFAMQKKRKRIYNQKGKRHWRSIDLGKMFTKSNRHLVQGKGFKKTKRNNGKGNRNTHRMHKKMKDKR
jgi:ribosomal protein L39E